MRYTLRQLEVFSAIAHHENMTRAAASLSMSQSAASAALKDLESQFDMQLFDRVAKRLQLNSLGATVWPKVESLLDQAQELQREFAEQSNVGDLRLGATLTIGSGLALDLIARLRQETTVASVKQLSLRIANTAQIVDQVRHFELDLGLIEGAIGSEANELELIPWCEDELVLFVSADHALSKVSSSKATSNKASSGNVAPVSTVQVSVAALSQQSWILREPGSGTRQTFDNALSGRLSKLDVILELEQIDAIKQAVNAGLGVSCLARSCIQEELASGKFKEITLQGLQMSHPFYIVLHRQKYQSASLRRCLQLCDQMAAEA